MTVCVRQILHLVKPSFILYDDLMKPALFTFILILNFLVLAPLSQAISDLNYQHDYQETVLPFLKTGEQFSFQSADGNYALSAVRFIHPKEKGLIVIVNGQSEPWLKYAEVFYDLYQKGYSIYSYDHRGQGLSPHLAPHNSQIGHVDHFIEYTLDLNEFIEKVIKPVHPQAKNLFLLAHSMGGGISSEYLELYPSPFQAIVLNAPMLRINTKPYPEKVARAIVAVSKTIGLGARYALGKHDYDCNGSFETNKVTGSPDRWWMNNYICKTYPQTTIGGPSSGWVNESMRETKTIRANTSKIKANILMYQAGLDQFVVNAAENDACSEIQTCHIVSFPNAQHEILMEKDSIRDSAFQQIDSFFSN